MALSDKVQSSDHGSRKRLVQPVLPALPRRLKVKNEPTVARNGNMTTTNGADAHDPAHVHKVEINVKPAAEPEQDNSFTNVREIEEHQPIDKIGVSHQHEQAVEYVKSDSLPVSTFDDDQNSQDVQIVKDAPLEKEKSHDETNRIPPEDAQGIEEKQVNSQAHVRSPSVPQEERYSEIEAVKPTNGSVHYEPVVHNDQMHQVINDRASLLLTRNHSMQPSISNSSTLNTPRYITDAPVSPQSAIITQGDETVQIFAERSASRVSNGHTYSASHPEVSNSSVMSPISQTAFPTIAEHIQNLQFHNDWADCDIYVFFRTASKPAIYRTAHSIILVRSPRLASIISMQRASSYTYYTINLAPTRPIDINAFEAALRFLYNDTLLRADRLMTIQMESGKVAREGLMDYLVSYMIAGLELGLQPVTTYALDLIGRVLNWDVAERAVKEALQLRSASMVAVNPHAPPDAIFAAQSVLQHVFNLIILRLDVRHFRIDTTTVPMDMNSRFANFEPGRSVNPALASMVFGSMPTSASRSPITPGSSVSPVSGTPDTIASSIMLNIDFEDLRTLASSMKRVHGEHGVRVMESIVEERERRRISIFQNRTYPNSQRNGNSSMWDVVAWREFLSEGSLRRENLGFLLPNKRGKNSDH